MPKSKDQKRTEAKQRAEEYSKLSIDQKLKRLPSDGSLKVRGKLERQLFAEQQKVVKESKKEKDSK